MDEVIDLSSERIKRGRATYVDVNRDELLVLHQESGTLFLVDKESQRTTNLSTALPYVGRSVTERAGRQPESKTLAGKFISKLLRFDRELRKIERL